MFNANRHVSLINEFAREIIATGKKITVTGEEETNVFYGAIAGRSGDVTLTYARASPKTFPSRGRYGADIDFKDASKLVVALKAGTKRWRCVDSDGEPLTVEIT